MRLLLINPSSGENNRTFSDLKVGSQIIGKKHFALPLALPTLASLTPANVDVSIVDEEVEPIDFGTSADLRAITALTGKANRAYQIAAEFRKRGKKVIMGGIHASMLPDEALQHVDCVVVGEAEPIWEQVVQDYAHGRMQRLYRSESFVDLSHAPVVRRDLVKNELYTSFMIQTKRGCPHQCTFCSVQKFNGRKVRMVGAEKVSGELENIIAIAKAAQAKKNGKERRIKIKDTTGRVYDGMISLFLTDDNFIINKEHVRQICSTIVEASDKHNIKISWMTHADISVSNDDDLLRLLSESGCIRLFIGFESLDNDNLKDVHKNCKTSAEYSASIKKIYSYGIDIIASFVIGNDHDHPASLDKLIEFTDTNCLHDTLVNILTPYPGTDLRAEMEKEGRVLSKDWDKYNFDSVVYSPKRMSTGELAKTHHKLMSEIFSPLSLYKKVLGRDHELEKNKNNLTLEPSPNRYFLTALLNLKAARVLKKEGLSMRQMFPILKCTTKYMMTSGKEVSMLKLNGFISLIDKLHYLHWKQSRRESSSLIQ
jgi:radical SAM superfamily enzyme YgiQ (UPF0313 family)